MSYITSHEDAGYWRDPLEKIWYCYREGDPKEYGHICPHCQKRYGEKRNYITLERCKECPPFVVGMDTPWNINVATKRYLKTLGYFNQKPKGGKPRRVKDEMDTTTMAAQGGKGNEETGNRS